MKKLIIAAAMCACACEGKIAAADAYNVYVDPAFGDKAGDVIAALTMWENAAAANGETLKLTPILTYKMCGNASNGPATGECSEHEFSIHPTTLAALAAVAGEKLLGRTYRDTRLDMADVFIGVDISTPAEFTTTVEHEVGHALALQHVNETAIMYPEWCSTTTAYCIGAHDITCLDVQQYASVRDRIGPSCN